MNDILKTYRYYSRDNEILSGHIRLNRPLSTPIASISFVQLAGRKAHCSIDGAIEKPYKALKRTAHRRKSPLRDCAWILQPGIIGCNRGC